MKREYELVCHNRTLANGNVIAELEIWKLDDADCEMLVLRFVGDATEGMQMEALACLTALNTAEARLSGATRATEAE